MENNSPIVLEDFQQPWVQLVAYTSPVADMTAEDFIVWTARISNPANQDNLQTSKKLLRYLVEHKHWSPLEMVDITLTINTTRDIARQILRHRFSFQEWSQRYANPLQLGFLESEARLQDVKNRQSSIEVVDPELEEAWLQKQHELLSLVTEHYEWAIEHGVAKEVARKLLPEGLTMSRMYVKGSVRNWIHYCQLRMGNGTQKEHQQIAKMCWEEIRKVVPTVVEMIEELEEREDTCKCKTSKH